MQSRELIHAISEKNYVLLSELSNKYDVNCYNEDGMTPLLFAAENGDLRAVNILLGNNANPDICKKGHYRRSPLGYAACAMSVECLKALIEKNATDKNEALSWSVYKGNKDSVHYMLDVGASPNTDFSEDGIRRSILMLAVEKGHDEILQILLDRGGVWPTSEINESFSLAARNNNSKCLVIMLNVIKNIDQKIKGTLLLLAAAHGRLENVELLLEHGADKNFQNESGQTALSKAAAQGEYIIIKVLLDHKANPKLEDKDKNKPIVYAVTNRNYSFINSKGHYLACTQLLFKAGGNDVSKSKNLSKSDMRHAEVEFRNCLTGLF